MGFRKGETPLPRKIALVEVGWAVSTTYMANDDDDDDLSEATLAGDLRRDFWPHDDAPRVNAYLGNGRFGGCFDAYGLQHNGWREKTSGLGKTVLMHADHRVEKDGQIEYLPLARWVWAGDAPSRGEAPPSYEQTLRLNQGWLYTGMTWGGLELAIIAVFHPVLRDVCVLSIEYEYSGSKSVPPLLLAPCGSFTAVSCDEKQNRARIDVNAEGAQTALQLRIVSDEGRAKLESTADGLRVSFSGKKGQHVLLLGACAAARAEALAAELSAITSTAEFLREGVSAWQKPWTAASVELAEAEHQALYERALYTLLCSHEPGANHPSAPQCGWSGNGAAQPDERAASCAAQAFHVYGLPEWAEADCSYAVSARSVDEFLAVTRSDAEKVQFYTDGGDGAYSLFGAAVFLNTVHATLLEGPSGAQTRAWPMEWPSAAFENLRASDGPPVSARYENGEWSPLV
jgi:hypothetical protein